MPTISGFQKVLLQNPHLSERRGKHDYTHAGDDNQMAALYSVCRRGKTNVLDYHTFSPLVNERVTQLYTARTCMERERNQWGSSASAGLNGSSVVIRAALDFNSGVHASAAQAGFSSWLSAALSYWSHQPPFRPPCTTDGNHKRPTCLFHRAVEGDMGTECIDLCKLTLQVLQVSGEVGVVKKVAVKITLSSSPCSLSHSVCLSCRGATPALCGAAGLQNSRLSVRSLPPSDSRSLPPAPSLLLRSSFPVSCTH